METLLMLSQKQVMMARTQLERSFKCAKCVNLWLYPNTQNYVVKYRYGTNATRLTANDNFAVIPFEFTIMLPAPNYQTIKRGA